MGATTSELIRPVQRTGGPPPARRKGFDARLAWWAIMLAATVLFTWDIQHSTYHSFYSETARSMTESWKGFLFGSFDPANTITIDKLPGFLWPQALSTRVFGFHPWALTLPQVVEGVLAVAVLHRAVRRWAGESAGLLAAGAFTLTPAVAGMFRTEVEDPAFTLCVLLAANATLRAAREARLRPLLMAGLWVGLGFQAKMLEAWAVLPALGLLYLLSAPAPLRRRLIHLVTAAAVCIAASASWMVLVALTPAQDRPFIDGTTDDSAFSQVVGYNFLNRFAGLGISAKSTGSVAATIMAGAAPAHSGADGRSAALWAKMFGPSLASQVGWLYPVAALSVVCGLVWLRGRHRTDPLRAGFLLWGGWLTTYFLVFSAGAVGAHTYYMGVVAVPLAALFGGGIVQFWRAWQRGDRTRSWALPTAVVSTVAWSAFIATRYSFLPWLAPASIVAGTGGLLLLALSRTTGRRAPSRIAVLGIGAVIVGMLLPSAAWASTVLDPKYGHSGMGAAGPVSTWHHHRHDRARTRATTHEPYTHTVRYGYRTALTREQQRFLAFMKAHQGHATFVFATTSWRSASPYILFAGAKVLPMGGFTGAAPTPTNAEFRNLIATGRLRYVVLGGVPTAPGRAAAHWVHGHCTRVPHQTFRVYDCAPASATSSEGTSVTLRSPVSVRVSQENLS
ncbi:ArnT family glycosyltransferase [Streptomyces sp. NRRL S-646]|uniref:ArnT family glycosyltransferase n=1 Tax=Streptomyces sp. NRRL S-646 TaxID=1463917 RepID=UPI001F28B8C7|nr:glycosyltransferase family 39 protein [Streptomyces sp. NRRL S-646]